LKNNPGVSLSKFLTSLRSNEKVRVWSERIYI